MRLKGIDEDTKRTLTFTQAEIFSLVKSSHGSTGRSVAQVLFLEFVIKQRNYLFCTFDGYKVITGEYHNIISFGFENGDSFGINEVIKKLKKLLKAERSSA